HSPQHGQDVYPAASDIADVQQSVVLVEESIGARMLPQILKICRFSTVRNSRCLDAREPLVPCKGAGGIGRVHTHKLADVLYGKRFHEARHGIGHRVLRRTLRARQLPVVVGNHRIDVVNDVRNSEAGMSEPAQYHGRVRRDRYENQIHSPLPAHLAQRKPVVPEATNAKITYADFTRQPGWQGARTDDLQIRRQQLLVLRIDRPFVISRIRRQDNRFPAEFPQMLGEEANPQRGWIAAGSEIGADNQDSFLPPSTRPDGVRAHAGTILHSNWPTRIWRS